MENQEHDLQIGGYPSKEKIAEWKATHGKVHEFTYEGKPVLIMRSPKVKDIERAQTSDPKGKSPFNFNRSLINNCKLWLKDGVNEEEESPLMMGIFNQLDKIVAIAEVEVKEL